MVFQEWGNKKRTLGFVSQKKKSAGWCQRHPSKRQTPLTSKCWTDGEDESQKDLFGGPNKWRKSHKKVGKIANDHYKAPKHHCESQVFFKNHCNIILKRKNISSQKATLDQLGNRFGGSLATALLQLLPKPFQLFSSTCSWKAPVPQKNIVFNVLRLFAKIFGGGSRVS